MTIGVHTVDRASPTPSTAPTGVSRLFIVGTTPRGPLIPGPANRLRSLSDLTAQYGARDPNSPVYDESEAFFRDGGSEAYVVRTVPSAAGSASANMPDAGNANVLLVTALSPGIWGNSVTWQVLAALTTGFRIQLVDTATGYTELSPDLENNDAAVGWSQKSLLVRIGKLGTNPPKVQASAAALSGGTDSAGTLVDNDFVTAIQTRIPSTLGAGNLIIPGRTAAAVQAAALTHGRDFNRFALLDGQNTTSSSALIAQAAALAGDAARFGMLIGPWLQMDGFTPGSTRIVPPSAFTAGRMADIDSRYGPNRPAAGERSASSVATDVMAVWDDPTWNTLNQAGVNIYRPVLGGVRLMGYRTLANPVTQKSWLMASNVRMAMDIKDKGTTVLHRYFLDEFKGDLSTFASIHGDLDAVVRPYFNRGSLWGVMPQDAYTIRSGLEVNTLQDLSEGKYRAQISLRMAPAGEDLTLELVRVPITQELTT